MLSHQDVGRTSVGARDQGGWQHYGHIPHWRNVLHHYLRSQNAWQAGLNKAMEESEGGFYLNRRDEAVRGSEGGIRK